ncbi:sigma-54 dependent transcriptional regulator [Chitinophaga horti]|uniref:Sigma-54 dependent transcriptional regulator n=1 Tax=Chitinophaga horti TaxID=2920382 RepID=A0ABY6IYB0_9BACT|nr:sigma-54 dependent transcriptional regulator [Chitinophaga horti]UYQ91402.1 sigma-54 dependent transcriptional regulator [Chitinophaga horti]
MNTSNILIVEDELIVARDLQLTLEKAGYHVCGIARSVVKAEELAAQHQPELVLLDIHLAGRETGIDLAHRLREQRIAFIFISANSGADLLAAAKATQPYGFLVKPFRERDVLVSIEIALYLHQQKVALRPQQAGNCFDGIVGSHPLLLQVFEDVKLVAALDTSVLITGESGTGKEQIAACIHRLSPRRDKALVKVNCAALPESLINSELFGHEKGAFTGATEKHAGKFEQAHGGTLFLDEIGEMSTDLQCRLLRALQEKEIEKLGGKAPVKIDTRIVAATNRDLEKEVAAGRFRVDLYYRLHIFPIHLPPLRERKEDIPELVQHFLMRFAERTGRPVVTIAPAALSQLVAYDWPGNVRELEHVIERSIIMAKGGIVTEVLMGR